MEYIRLKRKTLKWSGGWMIQRKKSDSLLVSFFDIESFFHKLFRFLSAAWSDFDLFMNRSSQQNFRKWLYNRWVYLDLFARMFAYARAQDLGTQLDGTMKAKINIFSQISINHHRFTCWSNSSVFFLFLLIIDAHFMRMKGKDFRCRTDRKVFHSLWVSWNWRHNKSTFFKWEFHPFE